MWQFFLRGMGAWLVWCSAKEDVRRITKRGVRLHRVQSLSTDADNHHNRDHDYD
jgi:hypothetical protein